jgi:TIR domain-containing protein
MDHMDDRRFRAFLSHSSREKPFVEAVAVALGRQHCVFDRYCFRTGHELQDAIERGLDSSALVVLFASKASLASEWVAFELDEAWKRKIGHRLSKVLTISIDASVSATELPPWLRTTLFRHFASPLAAAREVRRHLEETVGRRFQPIFVGRQHETQQFERDMLELDGAPKRFFVLQGLDGIGRRTFADRVSREILNFDRIVPFGVRVGDNAATITHALAVHVEGYVTPEELANRGTALATMPPASVAKEFVELVCKFHEVRELPVLVDEGGLLADDGEFSSPILMLLEHLSNARRAYLGFVSGRRPSRTMIQDSVVPVLHIPALRDEDTRRLLGRLFDREGIESTSDKLDELADYCKGYTIHGTHLPARADPCLRPRGPVTRQGW